MASAPEELTAYVGLITGPDGQPVVGVIVCWCGDLAEGERVLKPLRQFGSPVMDAVQPMPFPAMQKILDDAFPDGTQNYWKSTFLKALSDEAIDVIVAHANRMESPLSAVVIEYYAGAAGRTGSGDSAFANRKAEYDVGFMIAFSALTSAILVVWATRQVAQPLGAFAAAAESFSLGRDPATLPELGPREVQVAARAFNRMQDKIKRLISERTEMLASIGHDLRTPITRLRLRAEFMVGARLAHLAFEAGAFGLCLAQRHVGIADGDDSPDRRGGRHGVDDGDRGTLQLQALRGIEALDRRLVLGETRYHEIRLEDRRAYRLEGGQSKPVHSGPLRSGCRVNVNKAAST